MVNGYCEGFNCEGCRERVLKWLLEELVEKATPKKPSEASASELYGYCDWICPTCGRTHLNDCPLDYCSDCGQKID